MDILSVIFATLTVLVCGSAAKKFTIESGVITSVEFMNGLETMCAKNTNEGKPFNVVLMNYPFNNDFCIDERNAEKDLCKYENFISSLVVYHVDLSKMKGFKVLGKYYADVNCLQEDIRRNRPKYFILKGCESIVYWGADQYYKFEHDVFIHFDNEQPTKHKQGKPSKDGNKPDEPTSAISTSGTSTSAISTSGTSTSAISTSAISTSGTSTSAISTSAISTSGTSTSAISTTPKEEKVEARTWIDRLKLKLKKLLRIKD